MIYMTISAGIAAFATTRIMHLIGRRIQFKASCKYLYRCMKEKGEVYHDPKTYNKAIQCHFQQSIF
jgi:hypothetical protein